MCAKIKFVLWQPRDDTLSRNFTLSNSIILVEDRIMWKDGFEIFLINHVLLILLKIKISLVSIKKFLYQCHPPYAMGISSHRVLYLQLFDSYNIRIIYLHIIEACLKVTIAMIYFFHSKNPSNIMKNIFNCISTYSWKKIIVNKYKKQICNKKINLPFLSSWDVL